MNHTVNDLLNFTGQLADLKTADAKHTLAIAVLIDLLIEQGLFSRQEFAQKAQDLEVAALAEIIRQRRG